MNPYTGGMIPLHRDRAFTFRFADDRTIPRFHLDGVGEGRRVTVFRLDGSLWTTAVTGAGGWVTLAEPVIVHAGDGFVVIPDEPAV